MKFMLIVLLVNLFWNTCKDIPKPKGQNDHSFIITISEPDKIKEVMIPLQCDGWCVRGLTILENTTNDSTKIWDKYFGPGQTGRVFSMEAYSEGPTKPDVFRYKPYKATKGKIVMEWFFKPD